MSNGNQTVEEIRKNTIDILKNHGVKRAALFGSVVRGELTSESDIDMLIDIKEEASLLDIIRLKLMLEDVVKRPVDLVEYSAIKSALKDLILKEQVTIL